MLEDNPVLKVIDPSKPLEMELFTDDENQIGDHVYTMTVTLVDHPDVPALVVPIEISITLTDDPCKNFVLDSQHWTAPKDKEIIIGQYNFFTIEDAYTEYEIQTAIDTGLGLDKVRKLCGPREYEIYTNSSLAPFARVVA